MTYEKVKNLNPEEFKRFWVVYPETFNTDLENVTRYSSLYLDLQKCCKPL